MSRPRLLDLFCGAGGAAMGYSRAGFDVVGVDHRPQPRYPAYFIQADALEFLADEERMALYHPDAIHASPPCQAYLHNLRRMNAARGIEPRYPDLVAPTRDLLRAAGLPYVIENVVGAPLLNPVQLCGSSFGLGVRRHRLFETSFAILVPECQERAMPLRYRVPLGDPRTSATRRSRFMAVYGSTRYAGETEDRREAMGIDWMTNAELTQAIPPVYTEHIGQFLMAAIEDDPQPEAGLNGEPNEDDTPNAEVEVEG